MNIIDPCFQKDLTHHQGLMEWLRLLVSQIDDPQIAQKTLNFLTKPVPGYSNLGMQLLDDDPLNAIPAPTTMIDHGFYEFCFLEIMRHGFSHNFWKEYVEWSERMKKEKSRVSVFPTQTPLIEIAIQRCGQNGTGDFNAFLSQFPEQIKQINPLHLSIAGNQATHDAIIALIPDISESLFKDATLRAFKQNLKTARRLLMEPRFLNARFGSDEIETAVRAMSHPENATQQEADGEKLAATSLLLNRINEDEKPTKNTVFTLISADKTFSSTALKEAFSVWNQLFSLVNEGEIADQVKHNRFSPGRPHPALGAFFRMREENALLNEIAKEEVAAKTISRRDHETQKSNRPSKLHRRT